MASIKSKDLNRLGYFFTTAGGTINTKNWNEGPGCLSGPNNDVATLACLPLVFQNVINFLVLFAGVVAVFLLIYSGYRFVMSEGDPEKIASARRTAIFAMGGLVFIMLSFVFMGVIGNFTGVQQITPK